MSRGRVGSSCILPSLSLCSYHRSPVLLEWLQMGLSVFHKLQRAIKKKPGEEPELSTVRSHCGGHETDKTVRNQAAFLALS